MRNTAFSFLNISTSLALIGIICAQPATLAAQTPPVLVGTVVTVYQEANFKGDKRECSARKYRQADLPALNNDAASSIKVSPGYEIIIYENDNFSGASLIFDSDVANLADYGFNDKLSSMEVRRQSEKIIAKLFRDPNLKGMFTVITEKNPTIRQGELTNGVGNDATSSVWLDPAYEAIIFPENNYAGAELRITSTSSALGAALNDRLSSIMVRKKITGNPPTTLKFDYKKKVALQMPGHGYVVYRTRDKGINLDWSDTPVYEWEIQGDGNPSGKVQTGKLFRLYNHVEKDYLVYAVRDNGIHLRWLKDSKKKDAYDWTFESENLAHTLSAVFLKNRTLASDNKPAFVRYGVRDEGINLIFSLKTSFAPIYVKPEP